MQVLFVQGGGAGTHDEWDDKLCASLRQHLGEGHEVRYPRMPDEDDPDYERWSFAIRQELSQMDDGAALVGHSVGGTILVRTLAEHPPSRKLSALALIAAPFVGGEGWPGNELVDLGRRLPKPLPIDVFHGLADETAPPVHAELYGRAIPQAQVHLLPGHDHQLNNDLSEVARAIRSGRGHRPG